MVLIVLFAPLASEHSEGKKYHCIVYVQPLGMHLGVLRSMFYCLLGL